MEKIRLPLVFACLVLTACGSKQGTAVLDFQIGEKAVNPPLSYSVIESTWRTQLGEGFKIRSPQNRFLLIRLSVTNGGGRDVLLPLLTLVDASGKEFKESDNGEGVSGWFGLLRNLSPAQTQQGLLLYDVPLASYRLRLPNDGDIGEEKFITINIPLRMDADQTVQTPNIGGGLK